MAETDCHACGRTGKVPSANGYRPCRKCRGTGDLLAALGLRGRLARMTFEGYMAESVGAMNAVRACHDWMEKPSGFLILHGGFGTGKTHLACAMVRELKGRYMTLSDMVSEIQATYSSRESDAEKIRELAREKVLALDELGQQKPSDDALLQVERVFEEVYIMETPMVLVMNVLPSDIGKILGPRIADRIAENYKLVPFAWDSYRRKEKE